MAFLFLLFEAFYQTPFSLFLFFLVKRSHGLHINSSLYRELMMKLVQCSLLIPKLKLFSEILTPNPDEIIIKSKISVKRNHLLTDPLQCVAVTTQTQTWERERWGERGLQVGILEREMFIFEGGRGLGERFERERGVIATVSVWGRLEIHGWMKVEKKQRQG